MPVGRETYLRWLAVAAMALAAELVIAAVAIVVVVRTPSSIVARSTAATGSPIASAPNASAVPTQPPNAPAPSQPANVPPVPNSPTPSPPPTSSQSARPWAAGAFYPPSGKAVFFGGVSALSASGPLQASNETWTWDGAHWQQLHPVNSPPACALGGLVYDPQHQVLVLYSCTYDTWTWDGTNWKQMSPSESPPRWFAYPITYDATRKVVLLYVGVSSQPMTPPNQTWSWDGTTWTQIPTSAGPNAGSLYDYGTIVYDSTTAQTLFVGDTGTWVLETGGWRRIAGSGTSNGADYHTGSKFAVIDDPAQGVLVEVGNNGDTWTWDGTAWTAQNPPVAPTPRTGEALVYDASHKQVVLFGGSDASNWTSGLSDTWVWDGKTWKQVA